ncbi:hypothetical protein BOX15_Mlig008201g1 [Macrostomum lignano]|uniref:FERM domain-containing protein n=1 Tax=Macrostomum lignano TaxID=282301 RepID=A0A267D9P1_9PLAT|nr:hypothetical protein BOX15_Mlig008201g1 [Macrostomum lignano]
MQRALPAAHQTDLLARLRRHRRGSGGGGGGSGGGSGVGGIGMVGGGADSGSELDAHSERSYQLLCALCALTPPPAPQVLAYLRSHLNRAALDTLTDEGRYAQFCLRCLQRATQWQQQRARRRFPPSASELLAIFRRGPATVSVHLLNGDHRQLEFHPHLTGEEALTALLAKVPLAGPAAVGWALFEQYGVMERYTNPSDYIGDVLFKWEQYAQLSAAPAASHHHHHHHQHQQHQQQLRLVCKKRIFIRPFVSRTDHVESALLAHQCMTDVFEGRLPLDPALARELCGIRAASEAASPPSAVLRILPRSWRDQVNPDEVAAIAAQHLSSLQNSPHQPQHQLTEAERQHELNLLFIDACSNSWPLFGCALFEVRVNCPDPPQQSQQLQLESCVLAIGESGLHLLSSDLRQDPYLSWGFSALQSFCTESRYLLCLQLLPEGRRLSLYSKQATQMAYLIRDYMMQLRLLPASLARSSSLASSGRRRAQQQQQQQQQQTNCQSQQQQTRVNSNSCSASLASSPRPIHRARSGVVASSDEVAAAAAASDCLGNHSSSAAAAVAASTPRTAHVSRKTAAASSNQRRLETQL